MQVEAGGMEVGKDTETDRMYGHPATQVFELNFADIADGDREDHDASFHQEVLEGDFPDRTAVIEDDNLLG